MEQRTEEWISARLGRVTASKVKDVMTKGRGGAPSATRTNYMMQLLCERLTGIPGGPDLSNNAAVQRGAELEPMARSAYELFADCEVVETGLVLHPRIDGFGASPDGIVGERGLLELKAPNTSTHIATLRSGTHDSSYDWQMLAQMACTGRDWVDFVSFDDRLPEELQYFCARFHRDDKRIQEMEAEVTSFLSELNELEQDMRARMKAGKA